MDESTSDIFREKSTGKIPIFTGFVAAFFNRTALGVVRHFGPEAQMRSTATTEPHPPSAPSSQRPGGAGGCGRRAGAQGSRLRTTVAQSEQRSAAIASLIFF